MRIFKYGIFIFLLIGFFGAQLYIPALQRISPNLQVKELGGSMFSNKRPNFWPWAWLDGSYQEKVQQYLKNENELTPTFVRINTQLNFELFGEIPHEDMLMGKDNTLMPKSSWIAASGKDFIGAAKIEEQADQLKVIHDYLLEQGKRLLILTPPNKTTAMRDYLPEYYRDYPVQETNRAGFNKAFKTRGLNHIAFEHFVKSESEYEYPLYPQGGLHWTYYGYTLAADTIRNYIAEEFSMNIPPMSWRDSIVMKKRGRHSDIELYATANFLYEPELNELPYPKITYLRDSADLIKVLSVGDSYYKLLYDYGIHKGLFHEDAPFWYYASTLFPPVYRNGKKLNNSGDLDVLEVLENKDLVILTVVEGNLKTFGWGWVKRAFEAIEKKRAASN